MITKVHMIVGVAVGTIGGVGIFQQDPTGLIADVPEWLMPTAMVIVGILLGWSMWLTHQREKAAPPPLTREDLLKMEERITAAHKEVVGPLTLAVGGLERAVSDLRVAVAELK